MKLLAMAIFTNITLIGLAFSLPPMLNSEPPELEYCKDGFEFSSKYNECSYTSINNKSDCESKGHQWEPTKGYCATPAAYCGKGSTRSQDSGVCVDKMEILSQKKTDSGSTCRMIGSFEKSVIPLGTKTMTLCKVKEKCNSYTIAGNQPPSFNEYQCPANKEGKCPTYISCKKVHQRLRTYEHNKNNSIRHLKIPRPGRGSLGN